MPAILGMTTTDGTPTMAKTARTEWMTTKAGSSRTPHNRDSNNRKDISNGRTTGTKVRNDCDPQKQEKTKGVETAISENQSSSRGLLHKKIWEAAENRADVATVLYTLADNHNEKKP
jgi:hypothetical protein